MASNEENEFQLKVYPLDENEYIGTIKMDNYEDLSAVTVQTVIILDLSVSMNDESRRLANEILPLVLSKLSYESSHKIHLITFAKETQHYSITAEEMKALEIKNQDGNKMATAVQKLQSLCQKFNANQPIRILTISDGDVDDFEETEKAATDLVTFLGAYNYSINSQAVRLFTSETQPDTRVLCSLLQINNTTACELVDIGADKSNEAIAKQIAAVFQSDHFAKSKTMDMKKPIVLQVPWQSKPSSQVLLVPGLNLFWLTDVPNKPQASRSFWSWGTDNIKSPVHVIMQKPLTLTGFQELMETKLNYLLDHIKFLKIVGTVGADKSVDVILNYFDVKENKLLEQLSIDNHLDLTKDSSSQKKISTLLAQIANDENLKNFDSEKMAEYLRVYGKKKQTFLSGIGGIVRGIFSPFN